MKIVSCLFVIAVVGAAADRAYAFCVPGTTQSCLLNGVPGTKTCQANGIFGPCVVPPPPAPPSGRVKPKYKVLTVIYSPPGKQGGGSASLVSYGSGSSSGTTTSATNGFKQGYSISVTATGGILGSSTAGVSFSYNRSTSNTSATDIKKGATTTIGLGGPAVDGIDHDRDQIWLWLNPVLNVKLPTSTSVEWKLDATVPMDIQFVYVGHLKNPSLMPPGVKARLDFYGITTADYAEILEANPWRNGPIPIDPQRYVSLHTTFPYEPPFAPGDPSPTLSFTSTYSNTSSTLSSRTNEYSAGVSYEAGLSFISLFEAKAKVAGQWTWTDTDSSGSSTGTSEAATVTIGGPAFGYTGPTDMGVYYDLLYKTFMFAPVEGEPLALEGFLHSRSNREVAGREVVMTAGGVTYRTFADSNGEFRFYGAPGRASELRVGQVTRTITATPDPIEIELP
jgi:hypothetical protein